MSGLGGWGDPNDDFTVPDGGFNKLLLSYPSPHTVRRQFSPFPYKDPFPLFTDPQKSGSSSISASVVEAVLDTPAGDFKGFQVALELPEVR
jgi:tyrosinase